MCDLPHNSVHMLTHFLALHVLGFQRTTSVAAVAAPLRLENPVRDKNFYLFSLIERDPQAVKALAGDSVFAKVAADKRQTLKTIYSQIDFGKVSALEALKFTADERDLTIAALGRLADLHQLNSLIVELRRSGIAYHFQNLTDSALLQKVWSDSIDGINRVIDVYGLQTVKARSEGIDSPLYKATNPIVGGMFKTLTGVASEALNANALCFQATCDVAVRMLRAQLRDEAGRHEPLEIGENAAAFNEVRRTKFDAYPYSAMLVPGYGPEESQVRLSPIGHMGLELAARRYRQRLAPFIIVSGGYVHPNMTPYSEAMEMKRTLISEFGIPEKAIIVDPHARHTTTNIRNAVRLVFRYRMPISKQILVVTNPYQRWDIQSPGFARRCNSVFGYEPGFKYQQKSEFDVAFTPNLDSLTMDPVDPLDP